MSATRTSWSALAILAAGLGVALGSHAAAPPVTFAPSSSVQVTNASTNPVPVTVQGSAPLPVFDVAHAARQPFQAALCTQVPSGGPYCGAKSSSIAVPAGRRMVIEYASGRCPKAGYALSTGEGWAASVRTTAGGTEASHLLHPAPGISVGTPQLQSEMGLNGFDVTQLVRIYADPGSLVALQFDDLGGLGNNSISCEITISGYTDPL